VLLEVGGVLRTLRDHAVGIRDEHLLDGAALAGKSISRALMQLPNAAECVKGDNEGKTEPSLYE
jgi:hypothetical protein